MLMLNKTIQEITFRKKFVFAFIGVILLTGILTTVYITSTFAKEFREELDERGHLIAYHLAKDSVDPILTDKIVELQDLVNVAGNGEVEYAYILDKDGNVLAHTFKNGFPKDLKNLDNKDVQLLETEKGTIHDISAPILDGELGFVHVGMSESHIHKEMAAVMRIFYLLA